VKINSIAQHTEYTEVTKNLRDSVSMEFRVDGIPCRWNSVSMEFRVDGIPCRWGNCVSTGEFRINVFIINIYVFSFQKCVIGLADFRDL
jgi:hypothetical protein